MRILGSLLFSLVLWSLTASAAGTRPPLAKPYLIAPIVLDGKAVEEAWIFPRESLRNFSVEAKPVVAALRLQMRDELLKNLEKLISPEGVFSLRDLQSSGLTVEFDESSLELRLNLPLKYRKTKDLDLNYVDDGKQKYLRPSQQSGYFNFRFNQSYQYGSGATTDSKLPLSGHVDFVENVNGFVFESMADYLEGQQYSWRRQDTRVRKDDEENMIRYTLGDLTLGTRGFQLSPLMAGLSVVREFSIQPYRTLRPLSNTEILIKRTSIVEIYVNGFLYSQMRLAAGVFNIRDFPLTLGQNNVKVKIRDDLGQEETFDFSVLFENSILVKGEQEFSYSAGYPWTESGADRAYSNSGILSNFFHRVGITDDLTVGLNYQNYLSQALTGIEISGITNWGYFSSDVAYGDQGQIIHGYAERLRYRTLDRMGGVDVPVVLTLETENRDPFFYPVNANGIMPSTFLRRYDAQANFRPGPYWTLGLGGGYLNQLGAPDQRLYRMNLVWPFNPNCRVEFSLNKVVSDVEDNRGFVSFYWNEPQGHFSASSFYDSQDKSVNLTVNRNNAYKYDDYRLMASVQNSEAMNTESFSAEYLAQPASVRLEQYSTQQAGNSSNTTSLGINTGFAWVGSHGAFTQPINDSFVLVEARNLPKNQELIINPSGEKGEAQLGPRNSVVIRDESGYYKYLLNFDSTSLPMGYLLDKEFYGVQPTYRSGILVSLNLKRKVMVKGRLLKSDGEVLSFAAGDVLNSEGQLVDNSFFTNKNGGFLIEGLEPGTYKIVTDRPELSSVTVTIQDTEGGVVNLGDIHITKGGQE